MDRTAYKSDDVLFRDTHVGLASSVAANLNGQSNGSSRPNSGFSDQLMRMPNVNFAHDGHETAGHRHRAGTAAAIVTPTIAIYRHGETDSCGNITAVPVAVSNHQHHHRHHRQPKEAAGRNNSVSATLITEALVRAKHVDDPSANWLRTQQPPIAVISSTTALPGEPPPENINSKKTINAFASKTGRHHIKHPRRVAKNSRHGCRVSRTPSTTSSSSTGSLICGGGSDDRHIVKLTAKQAVPIPSALSTPAVSAGGVDRRRRRGVGALIEPCNDTIARGSGVSGISSSITSNVSDCYYQPSLIDASVASGGDASVRLLSGCSSKNRHSVSLSPPPDMMEIRPMPAAADNPGTVVHSRKMRTRSTAATVPLQVVTSKRRMWVQQQNVLAGASTKLDAPATPYRVHHRPRHTVNSGHTASCSMSHPSDESCSASYSSFSTRRDDDGDEMSVGSTVGSHPSAEHQQHRTIQIRRRRESDRIVDRPTAIKRSGDERVPPVLNSRQQEQLPAASQTDGRKLRRAPTQPRNTGVSWANSKGGTNTTRSKFNKKRSRSSPLAQPSTAVQAAAAVNTKRPQNGRRRKTITKLVKKNNKTKAALRPLDRKTSTSRRLTRLAVAAGASGPLTKNGPALTANNNGTAKRPLKRI